MKLIINNLIFEVLTPHSDTAMCLEDYFRYIKPELNPVHLKRIGDIYRYSLPKDAENIIPADNDYVGNDIRCGQLYFVHRTQSIELATRDIHSVPFSFTTVGLVRELDDTFGFLEEKYFLEAQDISIDFESDECDYARAVMASEHLTISNIDEMRNKYFPLGILSVLESHSQSVEESKYEFLTRFLPEFIRHGNEFEVSQGLINDVYHAVMDYVFSHDGDKQSYYTGLLSMYGIPNNGVGILNADISNLNGKVIIALLHGLYAGARFAGYGLVEKAFADGTVYSWLRRLDELDHPDYSSVENETDEECEEYEDDDDEYICLPCESSYYGEIVEFIEAGLSAYILNHNLPKLDSFKKQLLFDLDCFASGKAMEHEYDFTVSIRADEELRYIEFHFESESIEVSCGGSVYDPLVGHDSYSSWLYTLWVNGYEDASEVDSTCFPEIYELFAFDMAHFTIDNPEEYYFNDEDDESDEDEEE